MLGAWRGSHACRAPALNRLLAVGAVQAREFRYGTGLTAFERLSSVCVQSPPSACPDHGWRPLGQFFRASPRTLLEYGVVETVCEAHKMRRARVCKAAALTILGRLRTRHGSLAEV